MRFWAYLLDLIVIFSISGILISPVFKALDLFQYSFWIFTPYALAKAVIFYLYFVLMTKFLGQTLGKMVFGLKVISLKQEKLTWGTVIFREFIGRFISKTIWITYALIGILPKKQGIHDLFADTSVVLNEKR
nr:MULTISPECIES: RDD family protein [Bacillus]